MTPADRWAKCWADVHEAFGRCPELGSKCANCAPGVEDRTVIREVFERAIAEAVAEAKEAERRKCERAADDVFARWGKPELGLLRNDVRRAIRARGQR